MWLGVMTRPDIGNAVGPVTRQYHNPAARHRKAVIQMIQCVLGNKDLGLTLEQGSALEMWCLRMQTMPIRQTTEGLLQG